jgi:amidohydrolase
MIDQPIPSATERALVTALDAVGDDMVDVRRGLHRHPELGFAETATTALVRDRLTGLGLDLLPCPTPTGAVAVLDGGRPGGTVLIRADIDALPVTEATGLPYASQIDGLMHACGHDAHTAILLGVASALGRCVDDLPGRYVLLFQPAEETVCGAQAMVDGGLLEEAPADVVVGLHVTSLAPTGVVATRPGVSMAGATSLRLVVNGSGGHGALDPRQGNVVLAAARLADRLHHVVEGLGTDGTACVCSPGVIAGGSAPNVVPTTAEVGATLRTFDEAQKARAAGRLAELAAAVAEEFGVEVSVDTVSTTGPVRNDPSVSDVVLGAATAAGFAAVQAPTPSAASDDVSVLLDRVPGCYLFVGAAPADGSGGPHHSPTFAIDEAALAVGARVLALSAARLAGSR